MLIRPFIPSDTDHVAHLYHDTIREINREDYTVDQVKAWAPDEIYFKDWESFCLSIHTYVADDEGIIAGFAQLENSGYINCFYCHKEYQRMGTGSMLFEALLRKAGELGLKELTTESSITARPFFEDKGFTMISPQKVKRGSQILMNFKMKRVL